MHSAIYSTLNGFFSFAGGEKTKKSCIGEAGRRDDGRGCWRGVGARARDGGGMAGGVPVVLMVCRGAATIKVYLCTAFDAVRGGGEGYFCTVPILHRRRRWIGSRWRDADGSQAVRLEEGRAAAAGRRYPPHDSEGWDDMSVLLAEIFFEFRVAPFRCVGR